MLARVPGLPQVPGLGPEAERFRLFEAVSGFLIDIARRTELKGLLVLMDDLQWADRTSLLLMQHLGRKLEGVRLLVAGAYRAADLDRGHPLQGLLADLARERHGDQIVLPPLALEETSALIGELAGRPPSPSFTFTSASGTAATGCFYRHWCRSAWRVRRAQAAWA